MEHLNAQTMPKKLARIEEIAPTRHAVANRPWRLVSIMMHGSAATGVSAIHEARRRGTPIYGESLHQYMLYSSEDYKRPKGQIYHTYPSLKGPEDHAALWLGTLDGRSTASQPTRSAAP